MMLQSALVLIIGSTMTISCTAECLPTFQNCTAGCYGSQILENGVRICSPVGEGYFSPDNDNIRGRCPRGTYSDHAEAAECSICEAGSVSSTGASHCELCPVGFYQALPGQSTCAKCTPGYDGFGANAFSFDSDTNTVYCELTGVAPSTSPSVAPSRAPSRMPSAFPTMEPSASPSATPSLAASLVPSQTPSSLPTIEPSSTPSLAPSQMPSSLPTMEPSASPSATPSLAASLAPSQMPSSPPPSVVPSLAPSLEPTKKPIYTEAYVKFMFRVAMIILMVVAAILVIFGLCCYFNPTFCRGDAVVIEEDTFVNDSYVKAVPVSEGDTAKIAEVVQVVDLDEPNKEAATSSSKSTTDSAENIV